MSDQRNLLTDETKPQVRYGQKEYEVPFARVPNALMRRGDLHSGPRLLYAILATYRYRDGEPVWPSKERLAKECGVSERQVRSWQSVLLEEGYISIEDRPGYTPMIYLWPTGGGGTRLPEGRKSTSGEGRKHSSAEEQDVKEVQGRSTTPCSSEPEQPTLTKAQQLKELRDGIPQEDLSLIDEFLDNCAAGNQTNKITMGRRVNETRDLLQLRESLGVEPWRYGIRAANRRRNPQTKEHEPATNPNYIKVAAGSYTPTTATRYDKPSAKNAVSNNPTDETIVGWDALDEVTNNGD